MKNRQPGQIFGWLWVLISYIPLMTAPITQHALYIVALGWSIWLAYAILDLQDIPAVIQSKLQRATTDLPAPPSPSRL